MPLTNSQTEEAINPTELEQTCIPNHVEKLGLLKAEGTKSGWSLELVYDNRYAYGCYYRMKVSQQTIAQTIRLRWEYLSLVFLKFNTIFNADDQVCISITDFRKWQNIPPEEISLYLFKKSEKKKLTLNDMRFNYKSPETKWYELYPKLVYTLVNEMLITLKLYTGRHIFHQRTFELESAAFAAFKKYNEKGLQYTIFFNYEKIMISPLVRDIWHTILDMPHFTRYCSLEFKTRKETGRPTLASIIEYMNLKAPALAEERKKLVEQYQNLYEVKITLPPLSSKQKNYYSQQLFTIPCVENPNWYEMTISPYLISRLGRYFREYAKNSLNIDVVKWHGTHYGLPHIFALNPYEKRNKHFFYHIEKGRVIVPQILRDEWNQAQNERICQNEGLAMAQPSQCSSTLFSPVILIDTPRNVDNLPAEKRIDLSSIDLNLFSNATANYLKFISGKEKASSLLSDTVLKQVSEADKMKLYDPLTQKLIDIPVKLFGKHYDLMTILNWIDKKDYMFVGKWFDHQTIMPTSLFSLIDFYSRESKSTQPRSFPYY